MRTPPIIEPAAQLDSRTPKQKGSFTRAQTRGTRTRGYHVELPRNLWDRVVFSMFTYCLFIFLHAFFGFGAVDEDLHALNDPFVVPRATLSISSPGNRRSGAPNGGQEMRPRGMTRVMVDWHGNYELLPSTASALVAPASIPQDAFPDPTPPLVRPGRSRTIDSFLTVTTNAKIPVDNPFTFHGTPYDPFRLEFEDSADGGEIRGLYLVAEPPKTASQGARARRFGRCLPGEACL